MDIEETAAAYRRATMDAGTARDYIEDLMLQLALARQEISYLNAQLRQLEAERDQWQRQAVNNG